MSAHDPARPGWKTSEHWLVALATGLAALQPFVIDPSWQCVVVAVLAVLGSLGYSANRTAIKAAALQAGRP